MLYGQQSLDEKKKKSGWARLWPLFTSHRGAYSPADSEEHFRSTRQETKMFHH